MLSAESIEKINKVLKDKTFNYTGNLLHDIDCDVDFKIELLGYRNMISVGTEYPYMRVKIIFTKFKDNISKLIFGRMKEIGGNHAFNFMKSSLSIKYGLQNYLSSVLQFFDPENYINITIDEIEIQDNFKEETFITEQKKSREATRQVVRDIINTVKRKKSGTFYLPEDDYYSFSNIPEEFSVELTLKKTKKMDGIKVNANYVPDEQVIEILILFNPDNLEKNLYNLLGSLNELITHELEHLHQDFKGEIDVDFDSESLDPLEYYTQPHEIEAQVKGFRRISNLRKQPFETTVNDWFDTHKEIHRLSDSERQEVIGKLMDFNKKFTSPV